jgi:hypothetical protein
MKVKSIPQYSKSSKGGHSPILKAELFAWFANKPWLISTSRESLRIKDLLNPFDERWVQAPVESDDEDVALVQVMRARPAEDEEDTDDSDPVVVMTLKEAREMFVKGICFLLEILQANPSLKSISLLSKDWFEPWRQ